MRPMPPPQLVDGKTPPPSQDDVLGKWMRKVFRNAERSGYGAESLAFADRFATRFSGVDDFGRFPNSAFTPFSAANAMGVPTGRSVVSNREAIKTKLVIRFACIKRETSMKDVVERKVNIKHILCICQYMIITAYLSHILVNRT